MNDHPGHQSQPIAHDSRSIDLSPTHAKDGTR